jgi:rare lipoprotein A
LSYRKPTIGTSLAIRAAVMVAIAIAALALTARPMALATSGPEANVVLGVDADKAVVLSPEVNAEEKFEGADADTPALTTKKALMTASTKVAAPVAKPAKKVARATAPKAAQPAAKAGSSAGWSSAKVSWYGPGFYGRTMAGGGKLQQNSMVVAHRSLPFGTKIEFSYKGRTCTAVVQDRGPHIAGRVFDLGPGTAKTLGFSGVGTVQYRIIGR